MSDMPVLPPDPERDSEWETSITHMAADLRYPPTPDIAGRLRSRRTRRVPVAMRLAQVTAVVVLVFAALMAVPQVRAQVSRLLQIGVIRIWLEDPTPTLMATSTVAAQNTDEAAPTRVASSMPSPTSDGTLISVLQLPGATTLVEAQEQLNYPILMPTYPPDLGEPDHVFYLASAGEMVALVWLDPADPRQPMISLFVFGPSSDVWKNGLTNVTEVSIDGQAAIWTVDPHISEFWTSSRQRIRRQVNDPILIWFSNPLTYRLEGDFTLEEATQIMQSLE
jgi:hypothetical protein